MANEKELSVLIKMRSDIDGAISRVNSALDTIEKKGKQSSDGMVKGFKKATQPINDMRLAVARAGLIWGVFAGAVVKNITDLGNKIGDLDSTSAKLGISTEELSQRMYGFNIATDGARLGTERMAVAAANLGKQWIWVQTKMSEVFGWIDDKIQYSATFWGALAGGNANIAEVNKMHQIQSKNEQDDAKRLSEEGIRIQERFADASRRIKLSTHEYNKYLLGVEISEYRKFAIAETDILEYENAKKMELLQQRFGFKRFTDFMDNQFSQTITSMKGTMSGFFNDAFKGNLKSAKDYFADFGNSILKMFSDMVAEMIMRWLIFGSITGLGGGGIAGFLGFHSGGIAGLGVGSGGGFTGTGRRISVSSTMSAPNGQVLNTGTSYHSGGIVRAHDGLAVDEVPAILQTGEGVLSRRGMNTLGRSSFEKLNRGEGTGNVTIQPVVVIQAWSAQDVMRNKETLVAAVGQAINNNETIREIIRKKAR